MKPVIWMGNSKADLVAFPEEVRREIGYQLEHVQEGMDPDDWKPHAYRRRRGARNSRPRIVRSIPLHLAGNAAGGDLRLALFPKEDPENSSAGFGFGAQAIQVNTGKVMKTKKVMRERDEHGPRHVTPAGRSVFYDLFPKAEADELVMRSTLLRGLEQWLKESGLTQTQAAKVLGITQARVSDIKRGKFGQFSLDMLVRLASRAGLKPRLKLAA